MKHPLFIQKILFIVLSFLILILIDHTYIPRQTLLLMEGTIWENTVYYYDTNIDGPTIFVIGGIHGDETAGWKAALELSESCPIQTGKLYILPQANLHGIRQNVRAAADGNDLNRSFPGKENGTLSEQISASIFQFTEQIQPDLALDLHEAHKTTGEGGNGHSLICNNFGACSQYLLPFLELEAADSITSVPYTVTSPAAANSFNHSISDLLKIPVLTIETWRSQPLDVRVKDHLAIIHYFLSLASS